MSEPTPVPRRTFLFLALAGIGFLSIGTVGPVSAVELLVPNVTGLYSVIVARIIQPSSTRKVSESVRSWPGSVAIGGGRYSMGGQTGISGGLHLDMRAMNGLIWFKPEARCIRVQAGMRWRGLQDIIDPHNLSVQTMQSYANFTVGGSVSVNAHGRYVGNGPICNSIRALQVVLADGSIIEANADQNKDLFRAAIGGYGAVGVVTEVELDLAENVRMERVVQRVPLAQYPDFFKKNIESDRASVMHNADLIPPLFDTPLSVTWRTTAKPLTETTRLVPTGQLYSTEQNMIWALTELPHAEKLQDSVIRPMLLNKPVVKWRNHEASLDAAELEPRTRSISTYVLQEYFIPLRNFVAFSRAMTKVLQRRNVEALNVSIRHSPADEVSMLPWAKEAVFSFVLYYKQRTYRKAREAVGDWTRELIGLALENEGRYYLPYQLHATKQQFNRAYPEAEQLHRLKNAVDPKNKFSNELWSKYL
ncbi:FAD-binding oxidoreductase [Noviherbaspirillum sedimenti]|uniref:FAD-binding oxidoreductase n=1 Tax=Noviherbaspirillum sedimenti TaxID=2320865 RepID=A0A3A3G4F0_9BURK|nr:FAD-binding oxidoreductase [Noviherbaspirillum sedimenti]RJG02724.1 FAD-binding oxidoreductase [Noviherbaspirillum sedimenti]